VNAAPVSRRIPRGADWLGLPVALSALDYEPRDFRERAAAARAARYDIAWPILLTRCGTPPMTPAERRALWPEPTSTA
jgi:hypothetical protein